MFWDGQSGVLRAGRAFLGRIKVRCRPRETQQGGATRTAVGD